MKRAVKSTRTYHNIIQVIIKRRTGHNLCVHSMKQTNKLWKNLFTKLSYSSPRFGAFPLIQYTIAFQLICIKVRIKKSMGVYFLLHSSYDRDNTQVQTACFDVKAQLMLPFCLTSFLLRLFVI